MNCNITVIPGDGIGPEIVREACGVLDKVGAVYGHTFNYTKIPDGRLFHRRVRRTADR